MAVVKTPWGLEGVTVDDGPNVTERSLCSSEVSSAGVYVPFTAVSVRRGALPTCNGDEDAVTLAIAAGLKCLTTVDPGPVSRLIVVLGHQPPTETALGEVVREALGLAATTSVSLTTGDPLGAIEALLSASDSVASGRASSALVVGSEAGDGVTVAAGAAAVLVTSTAEGGLTIESSATSGHVIGGPGVDALGHRHASDLRYLETQVAATAGELLERLGEGSIPRTVNLSGPYTRAAGKLLAGHDVDHVGDFGVASPLLGLLAGATRAGPGSLAVLTLTPGRSALLTVQVGGHAASWLPDLTLGWPRHTGQREAAASPVLSLPTNSPFFARSATEFLQLQAAECLVCGHVAFPPSQRPLCSACGGTTWRTVSLAREGTVYTYTRNRFLPSGFGEEMILVLGEMNDGNRYWGPASGLQPEDVFIGAPVSLEVRRFTDAGGNPTYAMKFVSPPNRAVLSAGK